MASYSEQKKQEILKDYDTVLDIYKLREVTTSERRNLIFTTVQNLGAERLKVLRKDFTTVMLWVRHSLCLSHAHTYLHIYNIYM